MRRWRLWLRDPGPALKGGYRAAMKRRGLWLPGVFLLALGLGAISCARVFPPAAPPQGPRPAPEILPPSAVHGDVALEGDCLACHGQDQGFIFSLATVHPVPVPPGLTGTLRQACQTCHDVEESHRLARAMAHPVVGWEACLACHATSVAGARHIPPNHTSYALDRCNECHVPAIGLGTGDWGLRATAAVGARRCLALGG